MSVISAEELLRGDEESEYAHQALDRTIRLGRGGAVVAGIASVAFVAWDWLLDPNAVAWTIPVRAAIIAALLLVFIATYSLRLRDRPNTWFAVMLAVYVVVAVGWPAVLVRLPNGFPAGAPGFLLGMTFVPLLVTSVRQAATLLAVLVVVPLLVMNASGEPVFEQWTVAIWLAAGAGLSLLYTQLLLASNRQAFHLTHQLEREKRRTEALLLNILPLSISERLKASGEVIADDCSSATVLVADVVGFSHVARAMPAKQLVGLLNDLFSRFDRLCELSGVEKIKTIGDAYMAAAGTSGHGHVHDHAEAVAELALAMFREFDAFRRDHALGWQMRFGIHSSPLVAGVIGERKFAYDLWGDTVNIASRMESHGLPDEIQISDETRALLPPQYDLVARGEIALKGGAVKHAFLLRPFGYQDPVPSAAGA